MENKIKVAQYSLSWLPLTQNWMYYQICHLDESVENSIICEQLENLSQFTCCQIHCLSQEGRFYYFYNKILRRFISRRFFRVLENKLLDLKVNILHSHFANMAWLNQPIVSRTRVKHVVSFYGYDVHMLAYMEPVWRRRYQELFRDADLILCEGPFMAQAVVSLGCPKEKVKIHHLGVEVSSINFQPCFFRQGQTLRVLMASSFREKKGIPLALEALSHLKQSIPLEITLIGDASIDPTSQREKRKIMQTIDKFDMWSYIKLLGYQSHNVLIEEAYRHHLFLTPSIMAANCDSEGGAPVVILDMMSTGIVVIGSTHCDIPYVIEDGISGLLFEEGSVTSLVEKIQWVQKQPIEFWKSISQGARKRIEERYDVAVLGKELSDIYKHL